MDQLKSLSRLSLTNKALVSVRFPTLRLPISRLVLLSTLGRTRGSVCPSATWGAEDCAVTSTTESIRSAETQRIVFILHLHGTTMVSCGSSSTFWEKLSPLITSL